MRKEPEDFDNQPLSIVLVARKLRDALRVEQLLTDAGIDYVVEPDKYVGGRIFRTERVGAFFYVPADRHAAVADILRAQGFTVQPPDAVP